MKRSFYLASVVCLSMVPVAAGAEEDCATCPVGDDDGYICVTTDDVYDDSDAYCNLIDAIKAAKNSDVVGCCDGSSSNVVLLGEEGPYVVSSKHNENSWGLPTINGDVEIEGNGQTIRRGAECSDDCPDESTWCSDDGVDNFRFFRVGAGATLRLDNLSLVNGRAQGGGAVRLEDGSLVVENSTLSCNDGRDKGGGAILALAPGSVSVSASTFAGNQTAGDGGAILVARDSSTQVAVDLNVSNSTFSANTAELGGAVAGLSSMVLIEQSTFKDNTVTDSTSRGTALLLKAGSQAEVTQTILSGEETICRITSNSSLTSGGYNISQDASCGLGEDTDTEGEQVPLSALGHWGGSTETHALGASGCLGEVDGRPVCLEDCSGGGQGCSPAIDVIPGGVNGCSTSDTDQRGVDRPQPDGGNCDVGAYEAICSADEDQDGVLTIDIFMDEAATDGCVAQVLNDSFCEEDTVYQTDCTIQWELIEYDTRSLDTNNNLDGLCFLVCEEGEECLDSEGNNLAGECMLCTDDEGCDQYSACSQANVDCSCEAIPGDPAGRNSCWPSSFLEYPGAAVNSGQTLSLVFKSADDGDCSNSGDPNADVEFAYALIISPVGESGAVCQPQWDPRMAVKAKTSK